MRYKTATRTWTRRAYLTACVLAVMSGAVSLASAAEGGSVDIRRLRLSPHGADLLSLRGAAAAEDAFSFGALVGYGRDGLQVVDATTGHVHGIANHQLTLDLVGNARVGGSFDVGVHVPLVPFASGGGAMATMPAADGLGLGDVAISGKWLLVARSGEGFGVAIEPVITLPTATARTYAGDDGVTFAPRLLVDAKIGDTTVALNAGVRMRPKVAIGPWKTGSEWLAGVGVRHDVMGGDMALLGEVGYAGALDNPAEANGAVLEAQGGVGVCVGRAVMLTGAVGGGLLHGLGSTSLRATLGARFGTCGAAPPPPPPAPVVAPKPPPAPKPKPPAPRPPSDRDGDGIPDKKDACPDVPGPPSEVPARNGCPPPKIVKRTITIHQHIQFEVDGDNVLERWRPVLDDVAKLLRDNADVLHVRVEGHTDDRHTDAYNQLLSERRAAAVVRYLEAAGIDAKRLSSRGYGESQPIADNATEEGRQRNRRVVFVIVHRSGDKKADTKEVQ